MGVSSVSVILVTFAISSLPLFSEIYIMRWFICVALIVFRCLVVPLWNGLIYASPPRIKLYVRPLIHCIVVYFCDAKN